MSALGGILNFGSTACPVDRHMLISLGDALQARGPDGGGEAISAPVGMTYRAFHTTHESQSEVQPLLSPQGHMLTWDGRLDNRGDLMRELFSGESDEKTITDLEIVFAAYLKWGQDSFVRLIGDFCLALWDARLRVLFLVRDVLGTRPLHYWLTADRIIWSTQLMPLLDVANIPREVNEDYLAGFLTRYPKPELTPYKNVFTVNPQCVLAVKLNGSVRETRYWSLDPRREIRYQRDEDYEEHFLHEFCNGLKAHLHSHRKVFAELSGGLDSSSVVCVGDRLIKNGEAQAFNLEPISYVYDESPTADESKYLRHVEQYIGRTGHYLRESQYPILVQLDHSPTFVPDGVVGFAEYYRGVQKTMENCGARVLLTGEGGDQMLGSSDDPAPGLCDLLVQGRFLNLHKQLRVFSGALKRSYLWLLWQRTIIPTLPRPLQALRSRQNSIPPWFNANFVARAHLKEQMQMSLDAYGFRLPSGRDQSSGFCSVVRQISSGFRRERLNVEIRYPFMHRPLVEFLQAIPFEQRVRPGETRSLMRRSLTTFLPEKIAKRRTKGNPHEAICRAVIRELPRLRILFKDARVSAYGYVEPTALLEALELASHGVQTNMVSVLKTISLELWLRTLEQPRRLIEPSSGPSASTTYSEPRASLRAGAAG
jgi:asparagine synthase (glutamine-hydrolysing)